MNISSLHIVVLGGGESGTGAAILAKRKGAASVFLSDKSSVKPLYKQELEHFRIEFEEGQHSLDRILTADLVVKSPGIPEGIQLMQSIREQRIKVVSEIEFASYFTDATLIGITGTNGKTTTTNLCHHILKKAGYNVIMAGNVGNSFAREVAFEDTRQTDYYVLEISSFQLDDIDELHLHLSVLLNITPDHLDRYDSLEDYVRAKLKIANRQQAKDRFIFNQDDEIIKQHIDEVNKGPGFVGFSQIEQPVPGAYIKDDNIEINTDNEIIKFPMEELLIKGRHNRYNSMAAAIVAKALNVRKDVIRESLASYKNVEHRLEFVARIKNVDYINDSKATNVNAAWYALESMDNTTVWIAGGVDKGNDYSELHELVKEKVRVIICVGQNNDKLRDTFTSDVEAFYETGSMQEAVELAYKVSKAQENVLLAPACASFDLFENYIDRGNQFKRSVLAL